MPTLPDLTGCTIAFDLDGTLVDSAPDLVGALNAVLVDQGLPALPLELVRGMVGRGAKRLIQRGFEAAGAPLDEDRALVLVERFVEIYLERIAVETRPFPGVEDALDRLSGAGARLAVCTNKRTGLAVPLLEQLGMADRFTAIIGADSAPAAKPDARHLQAAVSACGGDMSRCLLVGDSETDYLGARAAKAPIVLVTFGYSEQPVADFGPDALVDHFSDVPMACARLLAPC
jgi:phosphoglycolate phosphatase